MINAFSSFFSNAKQKLSNPFFGTLIFVWLVRNWQLVFTLFNFDSNCTLQDKISLISSYFVNKNFCKELGFNILISAIVMFIGYILIILSRLLVSYVENNLMPNLYKLTVSKLVTNVKDYEEAISKRDEFFSKYNSEKEKAIDAVTKYESLKMTSELEKRTNEDRVIDLNKQLVIDRQNINDLNEKNKSLLEEKNSQKHKLSELEKSLNLKEDAVKNLVYLNVKKIEDLNSLETIITNSINSNTIENKTLDNIYKKLESKNLIEPFVQFEMGIKNNSKGSFNENFVKELFELKLLRFIDSNGTNYMNSNELEVTSLGKVIKVIIDLKK